MKSTVTDIILEARKRILRNYERYARFMFFIAKIPLPNLKPILSNDQDVPNAFEVQMDEYVELRVISVIYLINDAIV